MLILRHCMAFIYTINKMNHKIEPMHTCITITIITLYDNANITLLSGVYTQRYELV